MHDGEDRLLDAFLDEVVGGHGPPDVSGRILKAIAKKSGASAGNADGASSFSPPAGSGQAAGGDLPSPGEIASAPAAQTRSSMTSVAAQRQRARLLRVKWISAAAAAAALLVIAVVVFTAPPDDPPAEPDKVADADSQPVVDDRAADDTTRGADGDSSRSMPGPNDVAENDVAEDDVPGDAMPEDIVPERVELDPSRRDPIIADSGRREEPEIPSYLPTSSSNDAQVIAMIDAEISNRWRTENVSASPEASDSQWCRRVYLDLIGRIPTLDELVAFTRSRDSDKRSRLVDTLLDSDEYTEEFARNWTTIWTNILVGRSGGTQRNSLVNRDGLQQYLRRSFQRNKPYDRMVYELVSADGVNKPGEPGYNGAVNFVLDNLQENATTATAKTARYFLGMQVQCTQCHNHPFNDWQQNQFWELNSFFRQAKALRTRTGGEITHVELVDEDFAGESGSSPVEAEVNYELRNGLLETAYPVFVDGRKIAPQGWVSDVNRRDELAGLIVSSKYLSRAMVNRMWAHFLGYGFTKPVDDMGPHNPPSHPELLDRLAHEFAGGGYDLRRLMRWITLSEAYSLSSRFGRQYNNADDDPSLGNTPLFSHFYLRQMRPEELYESLLVATAAHQSRGSFEEQERLKSQWLDQFTIAFDTDEGDEMTTFNGSIPQVLMMMNGDLIEAAVDTESNGFLQKVVSSNQPNSQNINHLYLAALARTPSKPEVALANELLAARGGNAATALEDIWWAVLNSNEFILNH